jgi:starch synthase
VKVLFVTVEMSPFAKVGGLADVAGSLPKALVRLGHDVRVIMPRHRSMAAAAASFTPETQIAVRTIDGAEHNGQILKGEAGGGVPVYAVDVPTLFDRAQVYGEPDDTARWLAFCDALLSWAATSTWRPDVIQLNDWHAAFVATRLRDQPEHPLAATPRVYTIHNLAIHGEFDDEFAQQAGIGPAALSSPLAAEPWMTRNGMGQGILWCDAINTVSPTYAQEITTPEYGTGLDPLLRARQQQLRGILNGIDYDEFDPASDPRLPARFSAADLSGKATVKAALQQRLGLEQRADAPLAGIVTRLFYQKGADLAVDAVEPLLASSSLQLAVLGSGDAQYQDALTAMVERHPGRVAVVLGFDADLAQWIYGGTDLFLMPSRFEPCGLGQMIALRYGSAPVVRQTGGLADTVREWTGSSGVGNGFVFVDATAQALRDALTRAVRVYRNRDEWRALIARGMADDYSWRGTAGAYIKLYDLATESARAANSTARPA